jgi:NADPH-dependent glutamate synthase beta subunit-like oxidoreductase
MLKILRVLPFFLIASTANAEPPIESEVCLYNGTPAGVIATVAAARQGHTVSLVAINAHTGGVG